jgi:hypothetical protein
VVASDWAMVVRSVTGGTRSTVNVDRSIVNEDWAMTGPRRAWVGLDLDRVGLVRPGHVLASQVSHVAGTGCC